MTMVSMTMMAQGRPNIGHGHAGAIMDKSCDEVHTHPNSAHDLFGIIMVKSLLVDIES